MAHPLRLQIRINVRVIRECTDDKVTFAVGTRWQWQIPLFKQQYGSKNIVAFVPSTTAVGKQEHPLYPSRDSEHDTVGDGRSNVSSFRYGCRTHSSHEAPMLIDRTTCLTSPRRYRMEELFRVVCLSVAYQMANNNNGNNSTSGVIKILFVIGGILLLIGIVVLILYIAGVFDGNGGNGGNDKQFIIAVKDSQFVQINDSGNMTIVSDRSQATKLQKEDSKGEKPGDKCDDFPDSVTTFRLKVPSKSGDKNYLHVDHSSDDEYDVSYTDKAGKENRWAEVSNRLISAAKLADKDKRPGIQPKVKNGKVVFTIQSDCDDDGDNVRLVDANSSN